MAIFFYPYPTTQPNTVLSQFVLNDIWVSQNGAPVQLTYNAITKKNAWTKYTTPPAVGGISASINGGPPVIASTLVSNTSLTKDQSTSFVPVTAYGGAAVASSYTVTGATVTGLTATISPALPAGLTLSTTLTVKSVTGADSVPRLYNSVDVTISGTPTVAIAGTTFIVTFTDAGGQTSGASFNLTVTGPVIPTLVATQSVASTSLTKNVAAAAFTPVTGSGGQNPLSYGVSPSLPAGLSFNSTNGQITGTPTVALSATTFTVTVTDSLGQTASNTFSLTVVNPPALVLSQSVTTKDLTQNVAITAFIPVSATGGYGTLTYSISPTLPAGLSFSIVTGQISGTPTVSSAANNYTVTITDTLAQSVNATFSLSVTPAQVITVQAVPNTTLTQKIVATEFTPVTGSGGTGTLTYAVSPSLPTGLSFNSSNGLISGTPTVTSGLTVYTVTVTDSQTQTSSKTFSLTVNAPPALSTTQAIATKSLSQNAVATPFIPVTATGGVPSLVFAISPALPAGLTFSSTTGQVSGTPSVATIATTYTVTVTDAVAQTSSKTFLLNVDAVSLTTTLVVPTTVLLQNDLAASFTPVTGSGGIGTLNYAVSPALPTGLTFNTNNGLISGTPTVILATTNFTVTVTDSNNIPQSSSKTFSLTVNPKAVVTVQAVPSTVITQNISITPFIPVTASGGTGTLTYAVSPALPTGLSFNTVNGQISGNSGSVLSQTTYTVTVTDSNTVPQSSSKTFTLTVNALPALTTTLVQATATLTQNTAVTAFIPVTGTGGYGTLAYSISPALPSGLSFNTSNGQVTGTPSVLSGTTNYIVTVTDGASQSSNKTFSLTVNAGPIVTTVLVAAQTITQYILATTFKPVNGTGGYGTLLYSVSPTLPSGLNLNSSTGFITGTPTVVQGATTYTITVTDSVPQTSSKTFTLTVEAPPAISTVLAVPTSALTIGVAASAFTPVTATGGYGTLSYAIGTSLPGGLIFNTSTGVVSGTPTVISSSNPYTVTVTDTLSQLSSKTFSLSVSYPLLSTTQVIATKTITQNIDTASFTPVTYTGGYGAVAYSIAPALPSGLAINTSTGLISGIAITSSTVALYTVTATDAAAQTSSKGFSLTVLPEPPPPAVVATLSTSSYSFVKNVAVTTFTPVVGSGGKGTLSYSIDIGLPSGLTFIPTTGQILGTPTGTSNTTTYSVTVTDSISQTASKSFSIYVAPPPPPPALVVTATIVTKTLIKNVAATAFIPVTATGGVGAYTFNVSPSLPTGLTFLSSNGQIIGTPSSTSSTATYSITVADTVPQYNTATFLLNVINPPALATTATAATFSLQKDVTISAFYPVTATGGYGTLTYSISPTLPSGLSFNSTNGQVTGTPTIYNASTSYTITVTDQAAQSSSTAVSISVIPASLVTTLAVTSSTFVNGVTITAVTPVTATGGYTPYTYEISSPLPTGLAFSTSTGQITGKPTASISATPFTITVKDFGVTQASSKVYTLTVNNPPALVTVQDVPTVSLTRYVDVANVSPVSASGGYGTISFAITPTLPSGLSFNASNGKITGTPTQLDNRVYTITAADSLGQTSSKTFTLSVVPVPIVTTLAVASKNLQVLELATPFTPVTATGGSGTLTWAIDKLLPSGLTISTSTGLISGTPSVISSLTNYAVTVSDASTSSSKTFSLLIDFLPLTVEQLITVNTLTQNVAAVAFKPVNAIGGVGTLVYSTVPSLQAGLSINTSTGYISGTPTIVTAGTVYSVVATDTISNVNSSTFTLVVNAPPALTTTVTTSSISLTVNNGVVPNIRPILGTGGYGSLRYSLNNSPIFPQGLTFNTSTGYISGTPTLLGSVQTYTVTVRDDLSQVSTQTFNLQVIPLPITITVPYPTAALTQYTQVTPFVPVVGTLGYGALTYSINPPLSTGLNFDINTGEVSGTPTSTVGDAVHYVTVTDQAGQNNTGTTTIVISDNPPPTLLAVLQSSYIALTLGELSETIPVTGSSGYGTYSYSISPSQLPAGLTFNTVNGLISGTPTAVFTSTSFTITVTDGVPQTAIQSFNLAVIEAIVTQGKGYTGSRGYTGSIGVGYTGSKGNIGYIGSFGYTGSIGYTGSAGQNGYTGSASTASGYTGSIGAGYTGSVGNTGTGYTGSIGIGYTGSRGYVGSKGEKGDPGTGGGGGYFGNFDGGQPDSNYGGITSIDAGGV